jgi:hypothetical protein
LVDILIYLRDSNIEDTCIAEIVERTFRTARIFVRTAVLDYLIHKALILRALNKGRAEKERQMTRHKEIRLFTGKLPAFLIHIIHSQCTVHIAEQKIQMMPNSALTAEDLWPGWSKAITETTVGLQNKLTIGRDLVTTLCWQSSSQSCAAGL